jgi:hypothetical protein
MKTMSNKRKTTIIIIVMSVLSIGIYLYYEYYNTKKTLRLELAKLFDRPSDLIELNLPPADGRYPGSVLLTVQEGQSLALKREFRPSNIPTKTSQVSITVDGNSDVNLFGKFLGSLKSSGDISIQISLDELRLFEIDINADFKNQLLTDDNIINAEKKGLMPRAIVRAYEAKVTYTVNKSNSIKGEHWNEIKEQLIEVGGNLSSSGGIVIKVDQPSIVAYETVLISFISTNLDSGKPNDLLLKDYIVPTDNEKDFQLSQYNLKKGDNNVKYITLGNSTYQSNYFGNLRLVEKSIEIVSSVFYKAGAQPLMNGKRNSIIKQKQFDDILNEIESELKLSEKTSLLIFYYVGHAISGPNGHLYLVLNDYVGNPSSEIGEDFYHGLYRESIEQSTSPLSGSNFSDIFDIMGEIQVEYPVDIDGLYPVSKISKKLEKSGVPFIIMIDACYSHEQMNELRNKLNLTKNGDYYGPNTNGGPDEVFRYSNAIEKFGKSPYLNSKNVVVLSSAPGSIAVQVPNPQNNFFKNEFVAPLASRIYNQFYWSVVNTIPISYGDFVYSFIDVKRLGEVRTQGVTSWSDFSVVNEIKMLDTK